MSYATIAVCAVDPEFLNRVNACVSQEGHSLGGKPPDLFWTISGRADIEQAYAYALETGNPSPGGDETVITDQMILSAVQDEYAPPPPETEMQPK